MKVKKLMIYLFIFIFGFIAIALFNVWQILHPAKIKIDDKPENYGLNAETIWLTTQDGIKLNVWFIRKQLNNRPAANSAVILLHGYPAEKADLLPTAHALSGDFAVLLLDFRYFGQSQGSFTGLGYSEV